MALQVDVSGIKGGAAVRGPILHLCRSLDRDGVVRLLTEFTDGFSHTRVFLAEETALGRRQERRLVFKTGAGNVLRDEVLRYQAFIPHAQAYSAFVKMLGPEITLAGLPDDSSVCAIAYDFAATPLGANECVSLRALVGQCLAGTAPLEQVRQVAMTAMTAVGSLYDQPKPQYAIEVARYYLSRWAPDFRVTVNRLVHEQDRHLLTLKRLAPEHFLKELEHASGTEAWHQAAEQPPTGNVELLLHRLNYNWGSEKSINLHAPYADDLALMVAIEALTPEEHQRLTAAIRVSGNLGLWAPADESRYSFYEKRLQTAFPGLDLRAPAFRVGDLRVHNPLCHLSAPLLDAQVQTTPTTLVPAHGDLHPGNVLVVGTTPVLIDYGLAETELPIGVDAARLCGGLIRDVLPQHLSLQELSAVVAELLGLQPTAAGATEAAQRARAVMGTLFTKSVHIGGDGFEKLWPLHLYGYSWIGLKWDDPASEGPKKAHQASFLLGALALTSVLGDPGVEGPDLVGAGQEMPSSDEALTPISREADREGAVQTPHPSRISATCTNTQTLSHVVENPYQRAGALLPDRPSYVRRTCDVQLDSALKTQSLIALHGEFGIGKSSLLARCRKDLGQNGLVCPIDLQATLTYDIRRFHQRFFTSLEPILGKVDDWTDVGNALAHRPLAILLDEFGHLVKDVAQQFVPSLHDLAQKYATIVRVVVCLPCPMVNLLRDNFHFSNSKYWADWYHIEVGLLEETGVDSLLCLLPHHARTAAHMRHDFIVRTCAGRPKPLQGLCHDLFAAAHQGASQLELLAIIDAWRIEQ